MNYLSAENLSKRYGERVLFEDLTFGLAKGDKTALVAGNGTGKSTLLRILAGKDTADTGNVVYRKGIRIGYLEQEPQLDNQITVNDFIERGNEEIRKIIQQYNEALNRQSESFSDASQKALETATAAMDKTSAWDYEQRLKGILGRFGITDLGQKIDSLSGGQKKRLGIAAVILNEPDLLILDEPTNHLDVEMIEWLEKYLMQSNITLLMVTHDRYFLDRVCNRILELAEGKLYQHEGNYAYFLEKKAHREEVENTEIAKAGQLMKKELEWVRRSPKARTTKSRSRLNAFDDIVEKASSKKQKKELELQAKMTRMGGKILEMKKVYKAYGDKVILKGFDYTFKKGDRIGIIGKNGVGKSTFLKLITGEEPADSGKINTGETIVYGHYSQEGIQLKEDKRVIEVLKDVAEVIVMADGRKVSASQMLEQFMFTPDMQYSFVSKLSGGEKRRLALLMVLMKNPNFLILDEPTNDLDLLTLNKLEEFLMNFNGCILMVTHDRYFMDKIVDHFFIFKGEGAIKDFYGTYSEFRDQQAKEERQESVARKEATQKPTSGGSSNKVSYKHKYEYEQLEGKIEALEKEKAKLESILTNHPEDHEKLLETTEKLGKVMKQLEEKSWRWMELDDLINQGS